MVITAKTMGVSHTTLRLRLREAGVWPPPGEP